MPVVITHAVIHGFEKHQHAAQAHGLTKIDKVLDVQSEAVLNLVNGVATLLGKKKNYQTWGKFDAPDRAGPFRTALLNQSQDSANSEEFIAMTHVAMDEIVKKAEEKTASTGSHILFSQFQEDGGPVRLLIAMIKQKGGIQLDEHLVPVGITEIDMSKLAHAADIRIQGFVDSLDTSDAEIEEEQPNYLSFLSQAVTDEAASYFVNALGCVIGVSPKKATSSLLAAVDEFFLSNTELQAHRREAKERIFGYMAEKHALGVPATLSEITHIIKGVVPPEKTQFTEDLEEFFNSEKHQVPTEFFVHEAELRKHTKVKIETDDMQLKFDRGMVGTDENSKIVYNKERRTLTITDLSDKIIHQLDREMQS